MSEIQPATGHKRLGAAEVAALLRRDIASGKLQSLERLPPERALAETYGIARGTVRSALEQLASEGRVVIRPGSGAYVAETAEPGGPQVDEIMANVRPLELIDARFALEPHICRLAVLHARTSDFERAEALLQRMEACVQDPDGFAEADTEFHTALAESTGNSLLIWTISQINTVRSRDQWDRMRSLILNEATIRAYNAQHRAIVDAIRNRAPEEAANLMKQHLEAARLALTRSAAA